MAVTETILKVRDKAIQMYEGGDGPPLLYLHGAGTYWWLPAHDRLAARHRVLIPVHPGFGASTGIEEIEDIEDLVFHTLDVLDELGLDRVDVAGISRAAGSPRSWRCASRSACARWCW
jgi:pimeloyl-ACP methyl ester carboxylesterase